MNKIRKGDEVIVITGKNKGQKGKVEQVLSNGKLLVDGVNLVKKHVKPNPNAGVKGGIVLLKKPIQASNVMLVNPANDKPSKVGIKILKDGNKARYFKNTGDLVDV